MRLITCMQEEDRERFLRAVLYRLVPMAVWIIFAIQPAFSQQKSDFAGDYAGLLGPLHVKLHITVAPGGGVSANVDSPDQNMFALPCSAIAVNGQTLSFTVPAVSGEWMGTLSSDHNTLSGIWKQTTPTPLNLTRTNGSTPSASAAARGSSKPLDAAQHPPCTSTLLSVVYWDGSTWKPMTPISSHVGSDQGLNTRQALKNPFSPFSGRTNIITFKDPAAALTLGPDPTFCVVLPPTTDPTSILIGSLDVKGKRRLLETCNGLCASTFRHNADEWMPEKRVQPVDIERLSDTAVEITLKNPLRPGQYLLGGSPGAMIGWYDFGVIASNGSQ